MTTVTMTQAERTVLETFLATVWPAPAPTLHLPNERHMSASEYVRLDIETYPESEQTSMGSVGNRRHHRRGMATVSIHTALDIGSGRALALADAVVLAMESKKVGSVIFRAAQPGPRGPQGAWYVLVLTIIFDYYPHK